MPRGKPAFLSPSKIQELRLKDPSNPRIRQYNALSLALDRFIFTPHPADVVSPSIAPPALHDIVSHINTHYLTFSTDVQLSTIEVWRVYFKRRYGRLVIQKPKQSLLHRAIYVQTRHTHSSDIRKGYLVRKKSTNDKQIGNDYSQIKSNTTLIQNHSEAMMYYGRDFHARWHGSLDLSDEPSRSFLLDYIGVESHTVTSKTAGRTGISIKGDVFVAYNNSAHLRRMDAKLTCGGLCRLHSELSSELISGGVADQRREPINKDESSVDSCIRFGFGRRQKDNDNTRYVNGCKVPTLNVMQFLRFPASLRQQLMVVFECATRFVEKYSVSAFNQDERNNLFSKVLNTALGFPMSSSKFEYFDLVISRNVLLRKHSDRNNDHREGYNHCVVYSFFI